MKNFVLIGAAGYIAERHIKAIKDTENNLLAIFDISDSVGIIDSYFPEAEFFSEYEEFKVFLSKNSNILDFVTICSPNHLHYEHIKLSIENNINVICEKPLVIGLDEYDSIKLLLSDSENKIFNVLQLRNHKKILELKKEIADLSKEKKLEIELTYITSRGKWYHSSWKGDVKKSGGIATNIGIHFFDMLSWIFGKHIKNEVFILEKDIASGLLEFNQAKVKWFLSTDFNIISEIVKDPKIKTYRSIKINGKEFEFSDGFKDLHTEVYKDILTKKGFGLKDVHNSIIITNEIRNNKISKDTQFSHYLTKNYL